MARKVDEQKRQAVLESAAQMFLERGYEGVSIDEVADAAGVARRTVYNRFSSKDELFAGVAEFVWSELLKTVETIRPAEHTDPAEAVRSIANTLAEFWLRPQAVAFLRLAIMEGPRFPKLAESYFHAGKMPIFRALVSRLSLLSQHGLLSEAVAEDAELATRQLVGLVNEPLLWPRLLGAPEPSPAERARFVTAAVNTFLARYGV
jgi:AcrR family transcriptional regulator